MYVLITGGEPLLHKDFKKIYSELYSKGIVSVLNTNGYLLNDDYVDFLKKNAPSRINITLYGADDETYKNLCNISGGFSQVQKNIKRLKQEGFNLSLNMTFVKSNIHAMEEMVKFAQINKIPLRPTTYVFPSSESETIERLSAEDAALAAVKLYSLTHSKDEMKKYAENVYLKHEVALKEKPFKPFSGTTCRAGKSSYWIHSDGRLGFCGMKNTDNEVNVFKNSFDSAWKEAVRASDSVKNFDACRSCEYRFVCKRCFAMLATENVNDENIESSYTCSYYRAYTEKLMEIHLKGDLL